MDNVTPQPVTPQDAAAIQKSNKQKLTWGLVCLIGPTVLLIGSLLLYAIINFIFSGSPTDETGPLKTIINVILFLIGVVVTLTWLPGVIVGIILLATRKSVPQQ